MQSVLQQLRIWTERLSYRIDGIFGQVVIVLVAVAFAVVTGASA